MGDMLVDVLLNEERIEIHDLCDLLMNTYAINIPAETALTTTFALQANRQNVAGTERVIAKTGVDTPITAAAETILTVCTPVSIRVISTAAITITGEEDEVLASLYIEQLA